MARGCWFLICEFTPVALVKMRTALQMSSFSRTRTDAPRRYIRRVRSFSHFRFFSGLVLCTYVRRIYTYKYEYVRIE